MTKFAALAVLLVGCGSSHASRGEVHAVGTYIGGGSYLFGSDDCQYSGAPGVFVNSAVPENGPRFIRGSGRITIACPKVTREVVAVVPTGAKIWGEKTMKVGEKQLLTASLVAGDDDLFGEARIEWNLGTDCTNVASFGPVMGAQDTGGQDRSRDVIAAAKGACHVTVTLSTGSELENVASKGYQQTLLITVK
ncbi:MAG: hypothetical protein H0T46_01115 [Deltaproteobacteria bacterium]|nr:hypothetical protein [Deltaproteobacteria bacterium]